MTIWTIPLNGDMAGRFPPEAAAVVDRQHEDEECVAGRRRVVGRLPPRPALALTGDRVRDRALGARLRERAAGEPIELHEHPGSETVLAERAREYGDVTEYLGIPQFYIAWFIAVFTYLTMTVLLARALILIFAPSAIRGQYG